MASSIPSLQAQETADPAKPGNVQAVLLKKKVTIGKGETISLPVTVSPSSAKGSLSFQSSDKTVASVTNAGKLTGKKTGSARITLSTPDGQKTFLSVTVKKAPKKISLYVNKTTLKKGKRTKYHILLSPSGSASYQKTIKSLQPKIASVTTNGYIKAKKKGTAWITAKTYNGKRAKIKIRVKT